MLHRNTCCEGLLMRPMSGAASRSLDLLLTPTFVESGPTSQII